jgi:GT2 family glycosyltransferase
VRRLFEPEQGLSNSRNCGIAAAAGELIVFTDDDVFVEPGWLAAYLAAAERWPEAVFFGGRIVPQYERQPPRWVQANLRRFRNMFGVRDFGTRERPFHEGEAPFGGNMALRRDVLMRWQFAPELGRSGNGRMMGEETALFAHLTQHGYSGVWVPDAELRHFIPRQCFTRRYVWNYFRGQAQTGVRLHGVPGETLLWGAPRRHIRRFCAARLKSWLLYPITRDTWVTPFIHAAKSWGVIRESRAQGGRGIPAVRQ